MKKIILIVIIIFCNSKTFSQINENEKKYSEIELNQDFDYLVKSIVETHPNPFSVIKKEVFYKDVVKIKSNFKNGLNFKEFYTLTAPLISSISDGHTSIKFPGNKKILNNESELFPFVATCNYKNKTILLKEFISENSPIPTNSEIVSINNISAEEIINKIIKNTSGENNEYRLKMGSNFIFFGIILNTYFNFKGDFIVKYKSNNIIEAKVIKAITFQYFTNFVKSKMNSQKKQVEQNTADYILTIKPEIKTAIIDFKYFDDEERFDIFLKKSFDSINKIGIKNLIIDIRENGGGNSVLGDKLFKYISKNSFKQFEKTTVKFSQLQKDYYKQNCKEDSTFCETYKYISKQKNGKVVNLKSEELIKSNSPPNQFNGKIYLLTSLRTFSSASNFAQCFKNYKMGIIVGEETGGWIVCYGDKIITKLPNTEMKLSISTKKFYSIGSTDKDLHGIIPDIKIDAEKSLDYILNKITEEKYKRSHN